MTNPWPSRRWYVFGPRGWRAQNATGRVMWFRTRIIAVVFAAGGKS